MKRSARARLFFGCLAFVCAIVVIALALSPFVPVEKEQIALIVLGNVLGWPLIVLGWYFGSSEGSAIKTEIMAVRPSGTPADPVHVEEDHEPTAFS